MLSPDSPFYLTDHICSFVQSRFWWHVHHAPQSSILPPALPELFSSADPGPTPPLMLSVELVGDVELMAAVAAQAFHNRGKF
jgi:hypothetical protein